MPGTATRPALAGAPNATESRRQDAGDPYDRLRRTSTFCNEGFKRWSDCTLAIAGTGAVGGRIAVEAVRSGAAVRLWDFDVGAMENTGTQLAEDAVAKVDTVVQMCHRIRPGKATAWQTDIRHAGIRALQECQVLLDCTDDPDLAWDLTEISNGLGIPLLRCALDGSGQREFGRVLCSAGESTLACQLCSYGHAELQQHIRLPCSGAPAGARPDTIAGGAMAGATASLGLLQAQRLVTGHDRQLVIEREILVDWTGFQIIPLRLERSRECLSGHVRWSLVDAGDEIAELKVDDLFGLAWKELPEPHSTMSCHLHPLNTKAVCDCGACVRAVGTNWAPLPTCERCGGPMRWLPLAQIHCLSRDVAAELGILGHTLSEIGFPEYGAMITVRAPERPPVRLLLK
jgi:hypothetical protein